VALREPVVKNDEVSYSLRFLNELAVIRIDVGLVKVAVGEVLEQMKQTARDEVDTGGFQWLEKAGRQPHRDAIAVPIEFASAGHEAQETRLGQRLAIRCHEQVLQRLLVRAVSAGVNVAITHSVL